MNVKWWACETVASCWLIYLNRIEFVVFIHYCEGDEVKGNEINGTCVMHGGNEKCMQNCDLEYLKRRNHFTGHRCADSIVLDLGEIRNEAYLVTVWQEKVYWWAFVNTALNLQDP